MPVNTIGLTDAEVNWKNVHRENPQVLSMADMLREFTILNLLIFTGCMTSEDPEEFVDEVHKILVDMGATDTERAELSYYQLKDVAQT